MSWNAGGLRICETLSREAADSARGGVRGLFKKGCVTANFLVEGQLRDMLGSDGPDVVVMATQGEDSSDTYFHSDLLPQVMASKGYTLLARDKLNKVGEANSGLRLQTETGVPSGGALRTSVYVQDALAPGFRASTKRLSGRNARCTDSGRASGALATYFEHPDYGRFAYVNLHLPTGAARLQVSQGMDFETYRVATKAANTLCLVSAVQRCVLDLPIRERPDHVIMGGDYGCLLDVPGKTAAEIAQMVGRDPSARGMRKLAKDYDELSSILNVPAFRSLKEGVKGEGVDFMPTWQLKRGRDAECQEASAAGLARCYQMPGADSFSAIGWTDRILYQNLGSAVSSMECTQYGRFDAGNTRFSNHAAVLATFTVDNK